MLKLVLAIALCAFPAVAATTNPSQGTINKISEGGTQSSTATGAVSNLFGNPSAGDYAIHCTSASSCTTTGASTGTTIPGGAGLVAQTSTGNFSMRTVTGTASQITVTNGDGISGSPSVGFASQLPNVILGNTITGAPSALAIPSCSAANSALNWTTGSGFSCATVTGGGASAVFGTTAAATSPQRSGEASTGLFSGATGQVSVASLGTEIARFSTTGGILDLITAGGQLKINSVNALKMPATGTIVIGNTSATAATGTADIAIGASALNATTTGTDNIGIGSSALALNTVGQFNIAIGSSALATATGASGLVAVGYQALNAAQTTATGNTALGYQALKSATTGTNNTVIGYTAGNTTTTGSNNVLIGSAITAPAVGTNNWLNIGGLIFGSTLTGSQIAIGSGITSMNPGVALDLGANTTSVRLPLGNTAARPSSPLQAMLRYNTQTGSGQPEYYDGSSWQNLTGTGGGGSGTVTSVGLSATALGFTATGTPVTNTGTLTLNGGSLNIANGGTAGTSTSTANDNLYSAYSPIWATASNYAGIDPTGGSSSQTGLQNAINAAASSGRKLMIPAGTYLGCWTFTNNVQIEGAGPALTTLKTPNSGNCTTLATSGVASLWGTSSDLGSHNFALTNITLDGNKANNTTGNCFDYYGPWFIMDHVQMNNCPEAFMRTDWGGSDSVADGMEGKLSHITLDTSGKTGVRWNGPHDTQISDFIEIDPARAATNTYDGFELTNSNISVNQFHIWERSGLARYGFNDSGATDPGFTNTYQGMFIEAGITAAMVWTSANSNMDAASRIRNVATSTGPALQLYGSGNIVRGELSCNDQAGQYGLVLGQVANTQIDNNVNVNVVGCPAGVLNIAGDGGDNLIQATEYGSNPGTPYNGTPNPATHIKIVGDGNVWQLGQEYPQNSYATANVTKTSSTALSAITGLTASVFDTHHYAFDLNLFMTSSTTGGTKVDLSGGSATMNWLEGGALMANGTSTITARMISLTSTGCTGTGQTYIDCRISGTFEAGGDGTFIPRVAQSVSNGTATTVLKGSRMLLRRLD